MIHQLNLGDYWATASMDTFVTLSCCIHPGSLFQRLPGTPDGLRFTHLLIFFLEGEIHKHKTQQNEAKAPVCYPHGQIYSN
jgi:hypothetical protein